LACPKKLRIILEITAILAVFVLIDCRTLGLDCLDMRIYFVTKFFNRIVLFILVLALLKSMGSSFKSAFGFRRKSLVREIAIGILVGILLIMLSAGLGALFEKIDFLRAGESDNSEFITSNMETFGHLIAWIFLGILAGGFVEEIVRIFLFLRIEIKVNKWLALLGTSVLFGVGHWYRTGLNSFLITFVVGFALTSLFLLRKRNIIASITAHAFGDTIGMIVTYLSIHTHLFS
jgi:membrane protease YdiL (CAAX protease family)